MSIVKKYFSSKKQKSVHYYYPSLLSADAGIYIYIYIYIFLSLIRVIVQFYLLLNEIYLNSNVDR